MLRRRVAAVGLAGLAVLAPTAACGGRAGEGPGSTVVQGEFNALQEPEKVPVLLTEHLGYAPFVRSVNLYDNGFSAVVRDRNKPDNLDQYSYRYGEWDVSPVSVSVRDIENYEKVTFPLSAVSWSVIPSLIQQAYDGLDLEGEEVSNVNISKSEGDPPTIYIGVSGLRGNGRLTANADGTNVVVERN